MASAQTSPLMDRRTPSAPKECARCKKLYQRRENEDLYRFKARKYCGRDCSDVRHDLSDVSARLRLEDQVSFEPNSGCWLWIGNLTRGGYGSISLRAKNWRAHRAAYVLYCDDIPEGLVVRHRCDTPPRVNPDHLVVGTHKENQMDSIARDRSSRGERSPNSKLQASDIKEIRKSTETGRSLAKKFGVSPAVITNIRKRKIWKHVGE